MLTTIIAFCAFFSFQYLVFSAVLRLSLQPIKEDIKRLEEGQKNILNEVDNKMESFEQKILIAVSANRKA